MKRLMLLAVPLLLLPACGCPGPGEKGPAPAVVTAPREPEARKPVELVILDPLDWSARSLEAGGLVLQRADGSVTVRAADREKAAAAVAGTILTLRRRLSLIAQNVANAETSRLPSTPAGSPPQPYRRKILAVAAGGALEVTEDKSAFRKAYRPGHPDADADGNVQLPNVYVEVELHDWCDTCREYEVLRLALAALSARYVAPPAALIPEPVPPRPDEPKKTPPEPPKPVTPVTPVTPATPVPPAMPLPAPPK